MKRNIIAMLIAMVMAVCPILGFAGSEAFAQDETSQAKAAQTEADAVQASDDSDQAENSAAQNETDLIGDDAGQADSDQAGDSTDQTGDGTDQTGDGSDQTGDGTDQPGDEPEQPAEPEIKQGWNEKRTKYYLEDGTLAKGIFKAETPEGKLALYFADKKGVVQKKASWVYQGGKKYRVTKGGTIRTKEGVFTVDKKRYIIQTGAVNGAICRKIGPVKAKGVLYYVSGKSGKLGVHKAYKLKKKVYHVTSKGKVITGKHKWKDGKYYYSYKKGCLCTKAGMVVKGTKRFYVNKSGLVKVNKKFKYKNNYYIASKNGNVYTGLFKWNSGLYYASSKGVLKAKAGIITVDGSDYLVANGGKVHVNKLISFDGKKYAADSNGKLRTGLFKFKGVYYYAHKDHTVLTKQKVFKYGGHYYFNKKGGGLARNEFVEYKDKHYYAGDDAAFLTTTFNMKGVTFNPSSKGVLPEEEYRKLYPLDDDDDDY